MKLLMSFSMATFVCCASQGPAENPNYDHNRNMVKVYVDEYIAMPNGNTLTITTAKWIPYAPQREKEEESEDIFTATIRKIFSIFN